MGYVRASLIGGTTCALAQILMGKTKVVSGRMMVTLVVTGTILGAIGIYKPFARWADAGAITPLLGFGGTLWEGVKEGLQQDGFLNVFKGGFTSSAVRISGALIFRYLGSLIFKPEMKD